MGGSKDVIPSIKAVAETDFTKNLEKFDVPILIRHDGDDQIIPIRTSTLLSYKIVKGVTLKIYPGVSHGMCSSIFDQNQRGSARFLQGIGDQATQFPLPSWSKITLSTMAVPAVRSKS